MTTSWSASEDTAEIPFDGCAFAITPDAVVIAIAWGCVFVAVELFIRSFTLTTAISEGVCLTAVSEVPKASTLFYKGVTIGNTVS